MAAPRTLGAIAGGAALGLAGVAVILYVSGGTCSATELVFSKPLNALIGMPPTEPPLPVGTFVFDEVCGNENPSPLRTWFFLWGPICLFLGLAGAFAARNSGSRGAAVAAAIVVGAVPLAMALASYLGSTSLIASVAIRCSMVVVVVLGTSAGLGLLGGRLGERRG